VGFWISFPCIGRTRVGFSVSSRELRRAFPRLPRQTPEQRAREQAEIDRKAKAFAKRWTPLATIVIWLVILAVLCWLVSLAAAHAGTCIHYADGTLGVTLES
jgi:type VI protein secretion system component VasF